MNYPDFYVRNEKLCSMMESAIENQEPILWLFAGAPGSGKTLAAEIMFEELCKVVDHRKAWAINTSAHKLYSEYLSSVTGSDSNKNNNINWLNNTLCKSIVLLDDLGCEPKTEAARSFIANMFSIQYDWLRERNKNYVIITTNLNSNAIAEAYGERVMDRMFEHYTIVKFTGESFRKKQIKMIEV